MSTPALH
jgi:protein-S-isoprenylcysteine O-methyltransferase Ste14